MVLSLLFEDLRIVSIDDLLHVLHATIAYFQIVDNLMHFLATWEVFSNELKELGTLCYMTTMVELG